MELEVGGVELEVGGVAEVAGLGDAGPPGRTGVEGGGGRFCQSRDGRRGGGGGGAGEVRGEGDSMEGGATYRMLAFTVAFSGRLLVRMLGGLGLGATGAQTAAGRG